MSDPIDPLLPSVAPTPGIEPPRPPLTPAAQRALAEAEARRAVSEAKLATRARETGGRDGPDPVRYGDWEKGGIATDF